VTRWDDQSVLLEWGVFGTHAFFNTLFPPTPTFLPSGKKLDQKEKNNGGIK